MKRLLGIVAVVVAVGFVGLSSEARADHRSCRSHSSHSHSYSRPSISVNIGGIGFRTGYSSYGSCYRPAPVLYGPSHYDYRPIQVIPHRDHYHVIPGHYDYHRTGYWGY